MSDNKYPYLVNKFLHQMNLGSINTAKQYAYKLCAFLNYLEEIWEINYIEAETKHLKNFIRYMQYGKKIIPFGTIEGNKSGFTVQAYMNVIKRFYEFLYGQGIDLNLEFQTKRKNNPEAYLYGQNWDQMVTRLEINDVFDRSKMPIDYIKWYSDEQIEAILDNLKTYRDKAIFSISLDGCRIDEILSLQMKNYNCQEALLTLHRSKGRQTGNTNRLVVLSNRSWKLLEDYLFYERAEVEMDLLEKDILPPEEIFLNLRKRDDSYGQPIKYYNILCILKSAAERAGLDPSRIRTHSGRSTKAMDLFRYQAEHPQELSDDKIKEIMGWKSLDSANPYKNRQDKEITIITAKKLADIKEKRKKSPKFL